MRWDRRKSTLAPALAAAIAVGVVSVGSTASWASTLNFIHTFRGARDGGSPQGGLIIGHDGILYGTAAAGGGGTRNSGTIYSVTPPAAPGGHWTETVLYRFSGGADGGYPFGLTMDGQGNLYGFTDTSPSSFGSVFRLERPKAGSEHWRFATLYQFLGGSDGAYPNGLTVEPNGSLIGATSHGGTGPCYFPGDDNPSGCGTIFQLSPPSRGNGPWAETILYRFAGLPDAALPNGPLFLLNGVLWGTSVQGGSGDCIDSSTGDPAGCGAIFTLTPAGAGAWSEAVAFSFTGANGEAPIAGLQSDRNGALYGVTSFGGDTSRDPEGDGVVFQLVPGTGGGPSFNLLHVFAGTADGALPEGGLIVMPSGKIYGSTELYPDGYLGSVFSLSPPKAGSTAWKELLLAKFAQPGGYYVSGQLARDSNGSIYGATWQGGKFSQGTLFQITQ